MKKSTIIIWFVALFLLSFYAISDFDGDSISDEQEAIYDFNPCEITDEQKPNILFIVADDVGYGDIENFFPESNIRTPKLSKMAQEGMSFTNYHAAPVCSQSRGAILTGTFTQGSNTTRDMIAQYFRDAGYATGAFGKWHNGGANDQPGTHPNDRGFEKFIGFIGGAHGYKGGRIKEDKGEYTGDWSHTTDLFADKTIEFITESLESRKPFFGWLAFNAVHVPLWNGSNNNFSGRMDWVEKMAERGYPNKTQQDYYAVVEHMDDRIGDVLDHLDNLGISENTLVIFLSDNGAVPVKVFPQPATGGAHGSNGGYRGGKAMIYEGGIKSPCIMRWKGTIPEGVISSANVSNFDMYPTFREMLGVPTTYNKDYKLHGSSILDFLTNGGIKSRADVPYSVGFGGNTCVIYDNWKLVKHKKGEYTEPQVPTSQLYNLLTDPFEKNDLALDYPEKVQQLEVIVKIIGKPEIQSADHLIAGDTDCIPNQEDEDSDDDGIPDEVEGNVDTDGDGIPNFVDLDSDNDCINDKEEGIVDADGNGLPDYIDPDLSLACYLGMMPNILERSLDTDGDGMSDRLENERCRNPQNSQDLSFDFEGTDEVFFPSGMVFTSTQEMRWHLLIDTNTTAFIQKDFLNISANQVDEITVRLKSEIEGDVKLYWKVGNNKNFIEDPVSVTYESGKMRNLVFSLKGNPNWDNKKVKALKIEFPKTADTQAKVELASIHGPNTVREQDCDFITKLYHVNNYKIDKISIYPTMAENELTIELGQEPMQLRLVSSNGSVLKTYNSIKGKVKLDIADLPKGTYVLHAGNRSAQFIKI